MINFVIRLFQVSLTQLDVYQSIVFMKNVIRQFLICVVSVLLPLPSCAVKHAAKANINGSHNTVPCHTSAVQLEALRDTLRSITANYNGEIGVAVIFDSHDTLTVNNENKYPLMSVFKLHQAVALCHDFEKAGRSLDTLLHIPRSEMNPATWSPMMKEISGDTLILTVRDLLRYTLIKSDNNASNYLFNHFTGVRETDSYIAQSIPRNSFRLVYTEEEMSNDHQKCYTNRSSPLGVALLLDRLYTSTVLTADNQLFICRTLRECITGADRITAPLANLQNVIVGHKTGSGFCENGILTAHNDAAFITYGNNRHYTLVVMVKDFHGNETSASDAIARVSGTVYHFLTR